MSKNCEFLRFILSYIKRIMGNDTNKDTIELYKFKPFCVEKVIPYNSSQIPQPRSGHRVVCDSKNLYSFGGYNPHIQNEEDDNVDEIWVQSYPLFQELWRFNFASKKWLRYLNRRSLPKELASNAVIRKGNTLMVYSCVRFTKKNLNTHSDN